MEQNKNAAPQDPAAHRAGGLTHFHLLFAALVAGVLAALFLLWSTRISADVPPEAALGSGLVHPGRSAAQVRAFRSLYPCPATGRTRGACPGHEVDHIVPLCAGGRDVPHNMWWQTIAEHRTKTRGDLAQCRLIRREGR